MNFAISLSKYLFLFPVFFLTRPYEIFHVNCVEFTHSHSIYRCSITFFSVHLIVVILNVTPVF